MFTPAEHKAYIQSHSGCTLRINLGWCCLCDSMPIPNKLKTPEYYIGLQLSLTALAKEWSGDESGVIG